MGQRPSLPISSFAYNLVPSNVSTAPTDVVPNIYNFQYEEPAYKDLAVCFVYFNSMKSKRMLMNYLYVTEKLKLAHIPYFTIELHFDKPEIKDAYHIQGSSVMFHKERLCHLMERKVVPWYYSKLIFLDADIIFEKPNWYFEISSLLDIFDVVQPFKIATWLDITYSKVDNRRESVCVMDRNKNYDSKLHPGFGWAFKRSWFRRYGFFQYGITGSGDTLSAAAWLGVQFNPSYLQQALKPAYKEYCTNTPMPSIMCASGNVYHLWHGTRENRKYLDRHKILAGIEDIRKVLKLGNEGVFEITDKAVEEKLRDYFNNRQDDGV